MTEPYVAPCPFCGAQPELSFNTVSCGCLVGPWVDCANALEVWNTRPAPKEPACSPN